MGILSSTKFFRDGKFTVFILDSLGFEKSWPMGLIGKADTTVANSSKRRRKLIVLFQATNIWPVRIFFAKRPMDLQCISIYTIDNLRQNRLTFLYKRQHTNGLSFRDVRSVARDSTRAELCGLLRQVFGSGSSPGPARRVTGSAFRPERLRGSRRVRRPGGQPAPTAARAVGACPAGVTSTSSRGARLRRGMLLSGSGPVHPPPHTHTPTLPASAAGRGGPAARRPSVTRD